MSNHCETIGCHDTPEYDGYCIECLALRPEYDLDTLGDEDQDDDQEDEYPHWVWHGGRSWPSVIRRSDQLMIRRDGEKYPFAPWGDPDHADYTGQGDDARYGWSNPDMWTGFEQAIEYSDTDEYGDGLAFILQREGDAYQPPADPAILIDGDDVRDPDTGAVHPAFPYLLAWLFPDDTYRDISTSGTGSHGIGLGTLPEGVKQMAFALPDNPDFPDAEVEIYDGKRVCVATGKHVPDSPSEALDLDQEALETLAYAEGFLDDETDERITEYQTDSLDSYDAEDYTPEATEADETASDIRDVFAAIDSINAQHVAERTIVDSWTDDRGTDERAFIPTWGGPNCNGTANICNRDIWQDTGGRGFGNVLVMALIKTGDLHPQNAHSRDANGALFWKAIEVLRDLGYAIPDYSPSSGTNYDAETVTPPAWVGEGDSFDASEQWDHYQTDRYQDYIDAGKPTTIWGDDAGTGKTTNAILAALDRDRPTFVGTDKHAKAHELLTDDAIPDVGFHLKGGSQPRHDACMTALAEADSGVTPHCPDHGHPSECPKMCPVYNLDTENATRQAYEALVPALGPNETHKILGLYGADAPSWHGDGCPWSEQHETLTQDDAPELVVGVHEYQLLDSAVAGRDVIIDETPRLLDQKTQTTVEGLTRLGNRFETLASRRGETLAENYAALGTFCRELVDAIVADTHAVLDQVDAPDLTPVEKREYHGMGGNYTKETLLSEGLAALKVDYTTTTIKRIKNDAWNGEPVALDSLFAAAVEAGIESEAGRRAITAPARLTSCPECSAPTQFDHGEADAPGHVCPSCGWHEAKDSITDQYTPVTRSNAWVEDQQETLGRDETAGLCTALLPPSEAFNSPLVLDATATPEKVAGIYGEDPSDVTVRGNNTFDLDGKLRTTQVVGGRYGPTDQTHVGGQYHASTIKDSETARERIQRTIERIDDKEDSVLYGVKRDLIPLFDFPDHDNAEVLHYGGARGLNKAEYDAVVCIGAPHPDMTDLRRTARLLCQDNPTLDAGGVEHSTRRDDDVSPPVYRYLDYTDDDGQGMAVPTKHFSGVLGALFVEARENELEQFVHRIRPLLVGDDDGTKQAYLLTDVPTTIPVDEVVGFEELADPLTALVPVTEGAIDMLDLGRQAIDGQIDGFRPSALVERVEDDDGREVLTNNVSGWHELMRLSGKSVSRKTVYNYVHSLEDIGLLTPGAYEQRSGVRYESEVSTLKTALLYLYHNGHFKVDALRRLVCEIRDSDGSLGWVATLKSLVEADNQGDSALDIEPSG